MRINAVVSVTHLTPQCLATVLGLLPAAPDANTQPIWANRVDVQIPAGVTTYGYYFDLANFPPGTVANMATAGHVTGQVQPGTAGAPGLPFTDAPAGLGFGAARDITKIWIDIGATGTMAVIVSVDLRN
jgi:hypothetical protein